MTESFGGYELSSLERELIDLLRADARQPVAQLAKTLGVSRLTVQKHMQRLQHKQVIQGFTLRLHPSYLGRQIVAQMLIATDQKRMGAVVRSLEKIAVIRSVYSISGEYDLVADLAADTTAALDSAMDQVSAIEGVKRTHSSMLLAQKIHR